MVNKNSILQVLWLHISQLIRLKSQNYPETIATPFPYTPTERPLTSKVRIATLSKIPPKGVMLLVYHV